MIDYIVNNLSTIIVSLIIILIVLLIIIKLVKDKKDGKSSCSYGCKSCALEGTCHKKIKFEGMQK